MKLFGFDPPAFAEISNAIHCLRAAKIAINPSTPKRNPGFYRDSLIIIFLWLLFILLHGC